MWTWASFLAALCSSYCAIECSPFDRRIPDDIWDGFGKSRENFIQRRIQAMLGLHDSVRNTIEIRPMENLHQERVCTCAEAGSVKCTCETQEISGTDKRGRFYTQSNDVMPPAFNVRQQPYGKGQVEGQMPDVISEMHPGNLIRIIWETRGSEQDRREVEEMLDRFGSGQVRQ